MKKINWDNIRLVAILCVVVFLYAFTSNRNEHRLMTQTGVEFADNENYITKEEVNNLLIQNYGAVTGIQKVQVDLNKVEKSLESNPMVDKAEVYTTVDGKLKAFVRQRKPVARIFDGSKSYYLDYKGRQMPLSDNETARVLLVTGEIAKADAKRLHELLNYVYDDTFLKKNIIGLTVSPVGNMIFKSRGHDYDIVFGKPINIERKFKNYKAFLQDAEKDTLITNYKTVNLKFTQQVVCTKK
ncbi:cell division protein FtsQ [Flavobacterium sp. Sd200]|uniref:cell division protein FtsQ/DivIB n=1 Tax=Flavobacterium sp. Sd200 TaxID=2692211 RepID=UPI001370BE99|nr:cell division protein FtsQ [Flavobacterium sp. Sd200]MXN91187.1 cell division protein FtsQ [Flavobacterium sp. Sd200]